MPRYAVRLGGCPWQRCRATPASWSSSSSAASRPLVGCALQSSEACRALRPSCPLFLFFLAFLVLIHLFGYLPPCVHSASCSLVVVCCPKCWRGWKQHRHQDEDLFVFIASDAPGESVVLRPTSGRRKGTCCLCLCLPCCLPASLLSSTLGRPRHKFTHSSSWVSEWTDRHEGTQPTGGGMASCIIPTIQIN